MHACSVRASTSAQEALSGVATTSVAEAVVVFAFMSPPP